MELRIKLNQFTQSLLTRCSLKIFFLWIGFIFIYLIIYYVRILMLYYIAFYEIVHRPYILESYIIAILFLSFSHPSIYPYPLVFASQTYNRIIESDFFFFWFFFVKRTSVATTIWLIHHIVTGPVDPDNTKQWAGY